MGIDVHSSRAAMVAVVISTMLSCARAEPMTTSDGESTSSSSSNDTTGDSSSEATAATTTETGGGPPPAVPEFELGFAQIKHFEFSWMPTQGAQYYQLLESRDAGEPYVQVGADMTGLATSLTVPLHLRRNASYLLRACNDDGCTDSAPLQVMSSLVAAIGYFKASNTGHADNFGGSVALSGDGYTLAVGAPGESSNATGVDGIQTNDFADRSGAIYVFVRDDLDEWSQQAYIKASNTGVDDRFGSSVTLSWDGGTLAVGAHWESSAATGIDGDQADDSATRAGAAYVFVRDEQSTWSQQAYVKADDTAPDHEFGNKCGVVERRRHAGGWGRRRGYVDRSRLRVRARASRVDAASPPAGLQLRGQ